MVNIIVAFAKLENGRSIRNALIRNGIDVTAVCTKGGQVIQKTEDNPDTIVISGFRLADMQYHELREYLPDDAMMLVLVSREHEHEIWEENVDKMVMPVKMHKLLQYTLEAVDKVSDRRRRQKKRQLMRSAQDQSMIDEAKRLLELHNGLDEAQAHSYLQKRSMDSGLNLVETARMIIDSYEMYE